MSEGDLSMTTGNVQVRLGAGSLAPQTVTLVLPMAVAKDLLFALNLALGGGGGKKKKW
jgi:hypothetical protein